MHQKGEVKIKNEIENQELTKSLLGKDKIIQSKIRTGYSQKQLIKKAIQNQIFFKSEKQGLLEAEEHEQTLKFRQKDLKMLLPIKTLNNVFQLTLEFGKYNIAYSRDGKYILLGSSQGHLAVFDFHQKSVTCEINVKEPVKDICFLNSEKLYAAAQSKYLYIYDNNGIEIHRLKQHQEPLQIQYLPYHFLLASIGRIGFLKYLDISTGEIVAEYRTTIRDPVCMRQNMHNAILCVGDNRGCVQMFSPNQSSHLLKLQCHKSSINSLALHPNGQYMATLGKDGHMKIWDLRTYKQLYEYYTSSQGHSIDISQTGLLCLTVKSDIQLWKDWHLTKQKMPYMKERAFGDRFIQQVQFCPYEDLLGLGLDGGFESVCVPGSGLADYDSFEVNLFANKKQKREGQVQQLLDKLPHAMITLNVDHVGKIDEAAQAVILQEEQQERQLKELAHKKMLKKKKTTRGSASEAIKEKRNEFVTSEGTRKQITLQNEQRLKLKRAEKLKTKKDIELINQLEEAIDFDPALILEQSIQSKHINKQQEKNKKIKKL